MTSVDVIIPAREKLATLPKCLDAILESTRRDVRILVVDVGYPGAMIEDLHKRSRQQPILLIRPDEPGPVLANAAFNLAFARSDANLVCVIENDVLAHAGCVDALADALERGPWDLASPVIWDQRADKIHFDPPLSHITVTDGRHRMRLVRRPKPDHPRVRGERRIWHLEKHSFAGTRTALNRLYPFDEMATTRTDIDLSLSAFKSGLRIGLVPTAEVDFIAPPISALDAEFFAYRWDLDRARRANNHIVSKWHLIDEKGYLHFAEKMQEFIPIHK